MDAYSAKRLNNSLHKLTRQPDISKIPTNVLLSHSFHAVELLRQGYSPTLAARTALKRIAQYYPTFRGGLITVTKDARHGNEKSIIAEMIMKLNSKI